MKALRSITLAGKRYRLRYVPRLGPGGKGTDGLCDPTDKPGKVIKIRKDLRGLPELETYLHEFEHACNWTLDEDHVTQTAADMARALWRLGYRRMEIGT